MFLHWLLAIGLCQAVPSHYVPMRARGGALYANLLSQERARDAAHNILRNSTANYFDQPIWHDDPTKGTFKQRWFLDQTYWKSNGPIFLEIGGEGPMGSSPGGMISYLAKNLGACLLSLEHRYYGDSFPAPLSDKKTLTTLRVDVVMEDIASFIRAMIDKGFKGPWLVVGGSYSGALSAWFRVAHPELTAGSWSSSGVVNAVYNFTEFDHQIVRDLDSECLAALKSVTAAFESAWDDQTKREQMMKLFGTPDYFTKGDMAWMLADSAAMGPQYGQKAALCQHLVPMTDPLAQFAKWTEYEYGPGFGANCYYSTKCLSDPSMSSQWIPADYQWVQQCCAELAYWQVNDEDTYRSSAITLDYFNSQCQAAFGFDPSVTNVAFNKKYGGAKPNATNVIALNGSDDPWQKAAVEAALSQSYVEFTATCDGCGHCGDLRSPFPGEDPAITVQHNAIETYVTKFLKL